MEQNTNIQTDLQEAVKQVETGNSPIPPAQPQQEPYGGAVNQDGGYRYDQAQQSQMNFSPNPNSFNQYQTPYQGQNQGYNGYQQPNPYYQQPVWQQPQSEAGKGLAIVALIFGIIAILIFWVPVFGFGCGLTSIITAVISRRQAGRYNGMAIAGLICGICGTAFTVLLYGAAFFFAFLEGF